MTPVAADRVGVAVLTDQKRQLPELLASFTTLAPRLKDVTLSRARGAGPLRQRSTVRGCAGGCCWSATLRGTSTR